MAGSIAIFSFTTKTSISAGGREAGWGVAFEPGIAAVHHFPLHARTVHPYLRLVTRHALLTYARKHWLRWQTRVLGAIMRAEAGLRRWIAWWHGDKETAALLREQAAMVNDLVCGDANAAQRRLRHVVARSEPRA